MRDDVFVGRAKQLRFVRDLVEPDASCSSATALLAVHSAIALNDALLTIWHGRRQRGQDHLEAARETDRQCRKRGLNRSGVRHLTSLLSQKTAVSYGDTRVSHEAAQALAETSRRFETWTFQTCKELATWDRQQPA